MVRFAVRFLLASFAILLVFVALRSSSKWPSQLPIPNSHRYSSTDTNANGNAPTEQDEGVVEQKQQTWKADNPVKSASSDQSNARTKWGKLATHYPISDLVRLPDNALRKIPKIQYDFAAESPEAKKVRQLRLNTVRNALRHDWKGYKMYAWMKDEVKPLTGGFSDNFGGWAATLVDSLDTLWIMNLQEEFDEAVQAATSIDFSQAKVDTVNVFETTIRYMGGFLAAYDLSGQSVLLDKAIELGEMLYVAFDTPNRMPMTRWDWQSSLRGKEMEAGSVLLAEIGSLSLEFTRLTQLTGDPKFYDAIERITVMLRDQQEKTLLPGLWPLVCDARNMDCAGYDTFSLGAMADSTYEYLPKEHLLLGGLVSDYQHMYEKAIATAKKHLFFRPNVPGNPNILMSGIRKVDDNRNGYLIPEGQHLACFLGGMVGMASKIFELDDLDIAQKLTEGCVWAYDATARGIMPEVFHVLPCNGSECTWDDYEWREEAVKIWKSENKAKDVEFEELKLPRGFTSIKNRRYLLRPEAIESVWYMYRLTGNPEWMEKGWKMFKRIEEYTHTEIAHAQLIDVTTEGVDEGVVSDKMESFWTAETLKYFYLLFCDPNYMSLDQYVFNTEAHPFKRPDSA